MKEENRSFPAYDILVFLLLFVQQSIACLLESSEINQFPQSVIEYTIRKPIPKKESIGVDHYTKFIFLICCLFLSQSHLERRLAISLGIQICWPTQAFMYDHISSFFGGL
jgi:hypothetical protein